MNSPLAKARVRSSSSRRVALGVACVLGLCSTLAVAQNAARPGVHVVALPRAASAATQVTSTTLLETPHLALRSVIVPKGGLLAAHAAAGQVSVQALSGVGELRMGERSESLDTTRVIVLAPGTQHEVRAGAGSDLVLLVHEVAGGSCAGPGMGAGHGRRMGRPLRTGPAAQNGK